MKLEVRILSCISSFLKPADIKLLKQSIIVENKTCHPLIIPGWRHHPVSKTRLLPRARLPALLVNFQQVLKISQTKSNLFS